MINGIINIYKEKGYTSHDVVAKLRGITKQKKIGHTGTLDPDAEGVLPVCLGKATKICGMLTDKDKIYETTLLLGVETDTQDVGGQVIQRKDTSCLTQEAVRECILGYIGEYMQVPPMYSALKVNGKKLYELAREGKEVERKARKVSIYGIRILEIDLPRVRMEVHCSKGTYIRTLCHDIGARLGCGGCMETLLRTKVSSFTLEESVRLSDVEEYKSQGRLRELVLPVDEMFASLRGFFVRPEFVSLAYNGNALKPGQLVGRRSLFAERHGRAEDLPDAGRHTPGNLGIFLQDGENVRIYAEVRTTPRDGMLSGGTSRDWDTPETASHPGEDARKRVFVGIYRYDKSKNSLVMETMFLDREEL